MESIYEREAMLSYEEFKNILHAIVRKSLKQFPAKDVADYLLSDFAESETKQEYSKCVERFKNSKLEYPNKVFAAGISKLDNLLSLCFE